MSYDVYCSIFLADYVFSNKITVVIALYFRFRLPTYVRYGDCKSHDIMFKK